MVLMVPGIVMTKAQVLPFSVFQGTISNQYILNVSRDAKSGDCHRKTAGTFLQKGQEEILKKKTWQEARERANHIGQLRATGWDNNSSALGSRNSRQWGRGGSSTCHRLQRFSLLWWALVAHTTAELMSFYPGHILPVRPTEHTAGMGRVWEKKAKSYSRWLAIAEAVWREVTVSSPGIRAQEGQSSS